MKRRALIISNPGEEDDENYCNGVNLDVTNYTRFLTSGPGGFWPETIITHLHKPSRADVELAITKLGLCDYALVIFTGHGWFSTPMQTTILDLGSGEEIDFTELTQGPPKQTVILDCCRKKSPRMLLDEAIRANEAFRTAARRVNPNLCRRRYKEAIEQCDEALLVLYSCAAGELSGDDSRKGGIYSFNLLKVAETWAAGVELDPASDRKILSVVGAHNRARIEIERIGTRPQTPQIEKPRTGPYFPFCIVA